MESQQQGPIQLVVTLNPGTGKVAINGPIDNQVLCLGMLEAGKAALLDYAKRPKAEQPRVQVAGSGFLQKIGPGSRVH